MPATTSTRASGGGYRVAWLWTFAVALLLLAPVPELLLGLAGGGDGGVPLDKLAHLALFALLAYAWLRATRPAALTAALAVVAAVVVYGGLLELAQPLVASRGAEWGDVAADALGAGLALALSRRRAAL